MTTTTPSPDTQADRRQTARRAIITTLAVLVAANLLGTIFVAIYCEQPVPGFHSMQVGLIVAAGLLGLVAAALKPKRDE